MGEVSDSLIPAAPATDIYFQPAIALFVGEVGSAIYRQFCPFSDRAAENLLTYIPVALRRGIGLIVPGSASNTYSAGLADSSEMIEDKSLAEALTAMLDNVSWSFDEAGYIVINTHPHIYVVGHMQASGIRDIVKSVRDCWEQKYRNTSVDITYLYCCYPLTTGQAEQPEVRPASARVSWKADIAAWAAQEKINACYLYGDVDRDITDEERQTVDHAVATALFALLVTGMPCRPQYKALLQQQGAARYTPGTLSACLVSSPASTILDACRSRCAALLLDTWLQKSREIKAALSDAPPQKSGSKIPEDKINSVRDSIQNISGWMQTTQKPPSTPSVEKILLRWLRDYLKLSLPPLPVDQRFQPCLSRPACLSEDEYLPGQDALMRRNADLFRCRTLATAFPSRRWIALVKQRYEQTRQEVYPLWRRAASQLWELARTKVVEQLGNDLEGLKDLPRSNENDPWIGPWWLIAYADILDNRLTAQQDTPGVLPEPSAVQGKELENPEYHRLCTDFNEALKKLPGLRDIVRLVILALIAIPVLSLLLINILTAFFGGQPWLTTLFFPLFAGVIILWNIGYLLARLYKYLPAVAEAQNALLGYYWHLHTQFCEQEEHRLRMETITAMRRMIGGLRSAVLMEVKARFEREASSKFQRWFQDIAARHCIFVSNGRFFQQNVWEAVYTFLTARPGELPNAPKKPAETIFQPLSKDAQFQRHSSQCFYESGLFREGDSARRDHAETLYEKLNNLMQSMILPTSINRFMKIGDALKNKTLWEEVSNRIMPDQPEQGKMVAFLCGSKATLSEGIDTRKLIAPFADEIIILYTGEFNDDIGEPHNTQPHWFLVAALSPISIIEAAYEGVAQGEGEE
jgi:hypothetical protein